MLPLSGLKSDSINIGGPHRSLRDVQGDSHRHILALGTAVLWCSAFEPRFNIAVPSQILHTHSIPGMDENRIIYL